MSYEITGNRYMGAAMKKKQAYLNEWKIKYRRKIMPGYPIEKPFENRKQIDDYLNSDRLICLLCGKTFKSLCTHLSVHGTNADAYKEKYGLPFGCGLTCITTKAMNVAHGKRLVDEGIFRVPTPEEHAEMMLKSRGKHRPKPYYAIQEGIIRVSGKQLEKLFTDEHYSKILDIAEEKIIHPTDVVRNNKGELPSLSMLHKYNRENPDYKNRYNKIIENLPDSIKILHGKRVVNVDKIKQLKEERKSNSEIANILGVHEITIEKYNKKYGLKKPPPITCQSGLHPYPGKRVKCKECSDIATRKYHGTMDRNVSKNILIDRECTDCGAPIKVIRLYGMKKKKYCDKCKKKRYYMSQHKYAKEKRHFIKEKIDDQETQ